MLLQRSSRFLFLLVFSLISISLFLFYYQGPVQRILATSLTITHPPTATFSTSLPYHTIPPASTSTPPNATEEPHNFATASPDVKQPENGNLLGSGKGLGEMTKTLIVSSQKKDNTTWIDTLLPDWEYVRYVTDEPMGKFKVPVNKGNEAMVYLTYIIDNYHNLPDLMVFIHSERFQWHNDDPLWDNAYLLSKLQIPHLLSQPYTNLRCVWTLGCPSDIKGINVPIPTYLDPNDEHLRKHLSLQYAVAFPILFPTDPMPVHVSVPCCAQFATLSTSVLRRPLQQYITIRKWLIDTKLENDVSGRIMEFSWHIMFGAPAFACPHAGKCYCDLYGLCGEEMRECGKESCDGRWDWPPGRAWPKGWPEVGWDGVYRGSGAVEALRRAGKADKPPEEKDKLD